MHTNIFSQSLKAEVAVSEIFVGRKDMRGCLIWRRGGTPIPVLAVMQNSFVEVEGGQKQEKWAALGHRPPRKGKTQEKDKAGCKSNIPQNNLINAAALTCVSPGDGAGFGTEVGPVIGCGGLFISRSFVVLH